MVEVATHCQQDFDTLVEAGMDYTLDPISAEDVEIGDTGCYYHRVVFLVSEEIKEKYWAIVV